MLKNVVFLNEKKLRPDVFVRRYIDFLDGMSIKHIVKENDSKQRAKWTASRVEMDQILTKEEEIGKSNVCIKVFMYVRFILVLISIRA